MMTVPNCYKVEINSAWLPQLNRFISHPLDVREGALHLSERPGLGVELDEEYIEAHLDADWG